MAAEHQGSQAEFLRGELGDVRRAVRAARVVDHLVDHAGRSILQTCGSWKEAKACYRLVGNTAVDHESLLLGHRLATAERAQGRAVVLVVQDTTTLSFGDRAPIDGLGPIDSGLSKQGFFAHTALLVDPVMDEVLGVAAQEVWARGWSAAPKSETAAQRKKRARESEHWSRVQCDVARAFGRECSEDGEWSSLPARAAYLVEVFDREGDIFEAMEQSLRLGHGFVIRAIRDRKLKEPVHEAGLSFAAVETAPELGRVPFSVPQRPGQAARATILSVRSAPMALLPPKNRGRRGEPLPVWMVLVREETPPTDVEAVTWYLLTTEPCATLQEALSIVQWYRHRWRIEEFHMGLKTGCGLERCQLESLHALENFLALATVAAWRMLALRDAARREEPALPLDILDEVDRYLLQRTELRLPAVPTARQWLRALAHLGAFAGRSSQEPGWRTLWWGWQRLQALKEGWYLARGGCG